MSTYIKIHGKNSVKTIEVNNNPIECSYSKGVISIVQNKKDICQIKIRDNLDPVSAMNEIIDNYIDKQQEHVGERQVHYYSNYAIVAVCIAVVLINFWLNKPDKTNENLSIESVKQQLGEQEYYIDEEFANRILTTKVDLEGIAERKEKLFHILKTIKNMPKEERKKYLSSEEVKPWIE